MDVDDEDDEPGGVIDPDETSGASESYETAPCSLSSDTDVCKICHCGGEVSQFNVYPTLILFLHYFTYDICLYILTYDN